MIEDKSYNSLMLEKIEEFSKSMESFQTEVLGKQKETVGGEQLGTDLISETGNILQDNKGK